MCGVQYSLLVGSFQKVLIASFCATSQMEISDIYLSQMACESRCDQKFWTASEHICSSSAAWPVVSCVLCSLNILCRLCVSVCLFVWKAARAQAQNKPSVPSPPVNVKAPVPLPTSKPDEAPRPVPQPRQATPESGKPQQDSAATAAELAKKEKDDAVRRKVEELQRKKAELQTLKRKQVGVCACTVLLM